MFGTNLLDRRSKPERIADQAWQHLSSVLDSAGDTARSAGRGTAHFADEAGDRVATMADEAWHRAGAAFDALAGRRTTSSMPWAWIIGAGVVGAALGWAVGTAARAAVARSRDDDHDERIEFVDADRPGGVPAK
ncbi:hypothetical protein [Polymorphospora sp. NPDC050346]|uniref:hypothetical protein n=1 Tax=Polymorphospora sp. NPDC050346 TaxID=3155780 RepID=UPI0033FFF269